MTEPESIRNIASNPQTSTSTSTAQNPPFSTQPKEEEKKKTKKRHRNLKSTTLSQLTLRHPPWSYIQLRQLRPTNSSTTTTAHVPLDALTANLQITAALTQFLGLHGAAIPFDILKVDDRNVWVRVPTEDCSAFLAAMGGWVSARGEEGWGVVGRSEWDARASGGRGRDGGQRLFVD